MNDFLKAIRSMEDDVKAKREAEEKAEREKQEAHEAKIRAIQVRDTLRLASWLGIEADETMLHGQAWQILTLGEWELWFDTRHNNGIVSAFHSTSVVDKDGNIVSSRSQVTPEMRHCHYFEVQFTYIKPKISEDDRELVRKLDKLSPTVSVYHPLEHRGTTFKMKFHTITPIDSDKGIISKNQALELAGEMLDIEKPILAIIDSLPQWREQTKQTIQDRLDTLHEEAIQDMVDDLAYRAEREKRHQEWLAEQEAIRDEESEIASSYGYTFSGDTLGEILEQVTRAIVAQEQGEGY